MSNNINSKAVEALPCVSSLNPIRKTKPKPIVLTAKTSKVPSNGEKLIMLLQADLQYVTDDDEDHQNHIGRDRGRKQQRSATPDTDAYTISTIMLPGAVLPPAGRPLMCPPTLRNFLHSSNSKNTINNSISSKSIINAKTACL
jgi:hypothetical protein